MRDRLPILAALMILLASLTSPVWHGALADAGRAAAVIPAAKGVHCVRPVAWMRQNHMWLLMQLRDAAVHEGIRNRQESLPGCLTCHVSKLADGTYPSATSPKFFCNACHSYAGVSIDCFSCHANRPDEGMKAAEAGTAPLFAAGGAKRDAAVAPARDAGGAP